MRIQILPLTTHVAGPLSTTPFVVVIDRLSPNEQENLTPHVTQWIQNSWGAASVLVSGDEEIEISPTLELAPELQEALTNALAAATTGESN